MALLGHHKDGCIFILRSCTLKLERNAAPFGGAVAFYNVTSLFSGRVLFINNKATVSGGTLMMYYSGIWLGRASLESRESTTAMHRRTMDSSFITFLRNEAREGGAIKGISSIILIVVDVYFINNRAFLHGGAIFLKGSSKVILSPAVNTTFIQNRGESKGGALYVEDSECSFGSSDSLFPSIECFLSIYGNESKGTVLLRFVNNTAGSVGSSLYGGHLDKCRLYYRTNLSVDRCGNKAYRNYTVMMRSEYFANHSVPVSFKHFFTSCTNKVLSRWKNVG